MELSQVNLMIALLLIQHPGLAGSPEKAKGGQGGRSYGRELCHY